MEVNLRFSRLHRPQIPVPDIFCRSGLTKNLIVSPPYHLRSGDAGELLEPLAPDKITEIVICILCRNADRRVIQDRLEEDSQLSLFLLKLVQLGDVGAKANQELTSVSCPEGILRHLIPGIPQFLQIIVGFIFRKGIQIIPSEEGRQLRIAENLIIRFTDYFIERTLSDLLDKILVRC